MSAKKNVIWVAVFGISLMLATGGCYQPRYEPSSWETKPQTTLPDQGADVSEGAGLTLPIRGGGMTLPGRRGMTLPHGTLPRRGAIGTLPGRGVVPGRIQPLQQSTTLPGR